MTSGHNIYRLVHRMASFIIAAALLSGYYKILYPEDVAVAIYRFHLLPGGLINFTALYLPWVELICVACLLFIPRYRVAALWLVLVLLLLFTTALAVNLWRGSLFGCGCFGRGATEPPLTWLSIARNIGLALLAGLAFHSRRKAEG